MEKIPDPNLRAYIVWLPVLRSAAHEPAARREATRIPDTRATRFYDPGAQMGKLYSGILNLPQGLPAWDVYLVFGPETRWGQSPPAPTYWMHQLGRIGPSELRLDGEQLRRVIGGLLTKAGKQSRPAAAKASGMHTARSAMEELWHLSPRDRLTTRHGGVVNLPPRFQASFRCARQNVGTVRDWRPCRADDAATA